MNYLYKYLEFDTVEDGEKKLAEAQAIRDQMGGALYRGILAEDCHEISMKLRELARKVKNETV